MPIPIVKSNEEEKDYVSRCISKLMSIGDKDQKQVIAICYNTFRQHNKKKSMTEKLIKIKNI